MCENIFQNIDGKYVPAQPLGLCCEFGEAKQNGTCTCGAGNWYKRLDNDKDGSSWDDEPIFLCDEHAIGHEPAID